MDGTNYEIVYNGLMERLQSLDLEAAGQKVGGRVFKPMWNAVWPGLFRARWKTLKGRSSGRARF